MSISFLSNPVASSTINNLERTEQSVSRSMERLSSGKRINHPGDDPAGLARVDHLRSEVQGTEQARRNARDAQGFLQLGEGSLNEISNLVVRMRELAIQSASETTSDEERNYLGFELKQLKEEVERIAQVTTYNGTPLLNGKGGDLSIQVGFRKSENNQLTIPFSQLDARLSALSIDDIDLGSADDALDSLGSLDNAAKRVGTMRASLAAMLSRLQSVDRTLSNQKEALESSLSTTEDADVGQEAAALSASLVRRSAAIAVLSQANQLPETALRLLS